MPEASATRELGEQWKEIPNRSPVRNRLMFASQGSRYTLNLKYIYPFLCAFNFSCLSN